MELATSTEEFKMCWKQLLAREEEIALLTAERDHTRLLLEHLECLVSQYIPSLQMTAGKGQAQSPAGMTRELEVLKALKSLFEHHKALDKKAMAQKEDMEKRITKLEKRYLAVQHEAISVHNLDDNLENEITKKDSVHRQDSIWKKPVEVVPHALMGQTIPVIPTPSLLAYLARLANQAMAQKEDMEKRITTVEKCYLAVQHEAISVHNLDDKLENEIANKDCMHRQARQKEEMNEEHNEHSSDTVDKRLSVSDERLQLHLQERTAALEDKVQPLKDQDRERGQQASVLANVAQVLERDEGVSDGEGDGVTLFSAPALLSPSGQADAKSLAVRIQEQLDKINEQIRLLLANFTLTSLPQLPAVQEEVEDEKTTIKGETSTSALLRSLRLDRLMVSLRTASDEDIRDARNPTGSQDGPGGKPSNSNSSQDSLAKAPKKKGIKSSIGRLLGKKEKGRPGHSSKEALGPECPCDDTGSHDQLWSVLIENTAYPRHSLLAVEIWLQYCFERKQ
ncbi:hypothetical protein MJG53_003525 [Ovis ammon polii x Ovis aries]|uniref:Uncharacterized protein n=1 Tax=Ovis ammon polii x Ovis aries TaxID=2918886 RepID=A0ACB9VHF7_9CETA|nr:hypothetical protein MJG53_003525 [Ovis ammon polii x Ovis aries]